MKLNIDQQLKERLVGMAVLLFFAIIVIPWILDGEHQKGKNSTLDKNSPLSLPSPDGLKMHDINLQEGRVKVVSVTPPARVESEPSVPEREHGNSGRDQAESIMPAKVSTGLTVSTEIQSNTKNISSEKPKSETKTTVITPTLPDANISQQELVKSDPVSTWTVQLGSFGDKNNAERQVKSLADKGFPAFVSRFQNGTGKVLFRVRVGTEKDRARADKLQTRLAESGFVGKVLTHP